MIPSGHHVTASGGWLDWIAFEKILFPLVALSRSCLHSASSATRILDQLCAKYPCPIYCPSNLATTCHLSTTRSQSCCSLLRNRPAESPQERTLGARPSPAPGAQQFPQLYPVALHPKFSSTSGRQGFHFLLVRRARLLPPETHFLRTSHDLSSLPSRPKSPALTKG